jgi:hypothetical protein
VQLKRGTYLSVGPIAYLSKSLTLETGIYSATYLKHVAANEIVGKSTSSICVLQDLYLSNSLL